MPKAYWITSYLEIYDMRKVEAYAKLAGPAVGSFGGQYLARGTAAVVYEAGLKERTVLSVFPSLDAAVSAYKSPAYGEALAALGDGAKREIRIIEAVE
jgi:uncharacterized protein (DUF1330 family)